MATQFTDIEGYWKIIDYPQHPECLGYQFEISRKADNQYKYHLHTRGVNNLNCILEYNPINNEWTSKNVTSTQMIGTSDEMQKEHSIKNLLSYIQKLEVKDEQYLIIQTNNNENIRLERSQGQNDD